MTLVSPAMSQTDMAAAHSFSIPSQNLATALASFSRVTGLQIIADASTLSAQRSATVNGRFTPEAALRQLMSGSDVSASISGRTVVVKSGFTPVAYDAQPAATFATQGISYVSDADKVEDPGDLVVTGTRIARPELESAMPIGVVDMNIARKAGNTSAYETILRDVAVGPGNGPYNSAPEGQYDGGMATIELRNMGVSRSLTLVDGRRRVSSGASSSAVDINMIPFAMIERIEIVTGGAAAVYGADAVTGAANIITKRNFDGLEVSGTYGDTQHGGGSKAQVSLVAGTTFNEDRGSITFGATYMQNKPIYKYQRYAKNRNISFQNNPENTGPDDGIFDRIIIQNGTNMYLQPNATIFVGGNTYLLQPDGSAMLGRYTNGCISGCGTSRDFGDGGFPQSQHWSDFMIAPIENTSFIGRFDYELADWVSFDFRVDYGRSKYDAYRRPYRDDDRLTWLNGAGGAPARLDNPFLPDSFRDIMLANNLTSTVVSRSYENFGQMTDHSEREMLTVGAGFTGKMPAGFTWEAFWQHGRSTNHIHADNVPIASRFIAARDVIADPVTGQPVCRDEAARAMGCVPLDIFSEEDLTPEQREWMMATRRKQRKQTQTIFGGNLAGSPFALPAGEVLTVAGFEYRKESIHNVDDNGAAPPARELSHLGTWAPYEPELRASNDVMEFYGELVVPVLRDLPFAHRLTLEGAYRYSDYSDFNSTNTWKVGGSWAPVRELTLRAVKSKSVRVPNFGERYSARAMQEIGVRDACLETSYNANPTRQQNCALLMQQLGISTPYLPSEIGTGRVITGGSPDVTPEKSDSFTVGMVWQPRYIPGFDLTVDYWNIKIDNMITAVSQQNILNLCMDLPSMDNQFCDRVVRDSRGYAEEVDTSYMNVSESAAQGIDVGANYRVGLGGGMVSLSARASYLLKFETTTLPGVDTSLIIYDGGYQNPRFRGNLFANYSIGAWDIGLNTRMWGSAKIVNGLNVTDESYPENNLPAKVYNDLNVGWTLNDFATFRVGINNLFDVKPSMRPTVYMGGGGVYDVYGRYFFGNVTFRF